MRFAAVVTSCLLLLAVPDGRAESSDQPIPSQLPPDSMYVQVVDGQLHVEGKRVRFWGTNGHTFALANVTPDDTPAEAERKADLMRRSNLAILDRLEALGFNSVRVWVGFSDDGGPYQKGDGSRADSIDFFLHEAAKRGFKVWYAGFNELPHVSPSEVDIIDQPEDAAAWAAAVREACTYDDDGTLKEGWRLRNNVARIWDPRLEAIGLACMTRSANHFNQYNGLRWADDPIFGVWELSNEEWWMRKMVGGKWQQLPAFFRDQLIAHWQSFLSGKYGGDDRLREAWDGLLEGESLETGTVLLAPMARPTQGAVSIGDANPYAREALSVLEQEYSRDDFSPTRASDVLEFFLGLQLAHKRRSEAAIKPLGKSTRLSPMIYDTGIGYEVQSQYLHQQADAVAHDAYVNGFGPPFEKMIEKVDDAFNDFEAERLTLGAERISANDGPWVNWLRKPPGISQGVPWLEHNRVEGMPYLCYETNIMQPAKYRADFPLRVLALASIQDWDWVCWHYFGDRSLNGLADDPTRFQDQIMDVTVGGWPQGYHYTYDEVLSSMIRAAGYQFRNYAFPPAPTPTRFIYGRKTLYDPASMDYGHSYGRTGLDMLQTTYQHGVRIEIDPSREDDAVEGPVVSYVDRSAHNPYTPTPEIRFDWKKGYLSLDSPSAVAFTGSLVEFGGRFTFSQGVELSGVSLHSPADSPFPPDPKQQYIAFSLYSQDGLPLSKCARASLSLVSTSFNTGLTLRENGPARDRGRLPIQSTRVSATIVSPALRGMRYTLYDWSMQKIGEGHVQGDRFELPADSVFVVTFERDATP